jgi:hypothetical protein
MRPNPVAPWELRIGHLRAYYEIRGGRNCGSHLGGWQTLAECTRGIDAEPLVVTEGGRPIAVLLPLVNADVETVSLSSNPQFLKLIDC